MDKNASRYQDRNIQRHPNTGVNQGFNVLQDCLPIFCTGLRLPGEKKVRWKDVKRLRQKSTPLWKKPSFLTRVQQLALSSQTWWPGMDLPQKLRFKTLNRWSENGRRSFCRDFRIHCAAKRIAVKRKNGRARNHELRTVRIYKHPGVSTKIGSRNLSKKKYYLIYCFSRLGDPSGICHLLGQPQPPSRTFLLESVSCRVGALFSMVFLRFGTSLIMYV